MEDNVIDLFGKEIKNNEDFEDNFIEETIKRIDILITKGKIAKELRIDLVETLYSVRNRAFYKSKEYFTEWFKNKTKSWLNEIKKSDSPLV